MFGAIGGRKEINWGETFLRVWAFLLLLGSVANLTYSLFLFENMSIWQVILTVLGAISWILVATLILRVLDLGESVRGMREDLARLGKLPDDNLRAGTIEEFGKAVDRFKGRLDPAELSSAPEK